MQMHGMWHTRLRVAYAPDLRGTLSHHDGSAVHVEGQPVMVQPAMWRMAGTKGRSVPPAIGLEMEGSPLGRLLS